MYGLCMVIHLDQVWIVELECRRNQFLV